MPESHTYYVQFTRDPNDPNHVIEMKLERITDSQVGTFEFTEDEGPEFLDEPHHD